MRCKAKTADGKRCTREAEPGKSYCWQHETPRMVMRKRCPMRFPEDKWLMDNASCSNVFKDDKTKLWVVVPYHGVSVWKGTKTAIPHERLTSQVTWVGQWENAHQYCGKRGYLYRAVFKDPPKLVILNNSDNVKRLMTRMTEKEKDIMSVITGIGLTEMKKSRYARFPCEYKRKSTDKFARFSMTDLDISALKSICKHWGKDGIEGWYQQTVFYCGDRRKKELFMSEMALCNPRKNLDIAAVYRPK